MSRRQCWSCAATPEDGAEFPLKPLGGLCNSCIAEADRILARWRLGAAAPARRPIITRASYRAAKRLRDQSPQLDLVDQVVVSP